MSANPHIESALFFVSTRFKEEIDLDSIASSSGLSKYHFHRIFVERQGCTPRSYVEKVRLEHAAHFMIVYADISLTEVAFESGFSSPSCFSRAFRKYFSVSPSGYREKYRLPVAETVPEASGKIPVRYLSSIMVNVKRAELTDPAFSEKILNLRETDAASSLAFGFFLDIPGHLPLNECRYYIGTGASRSIPSHSGDVLTMPSGYYTTVKITGTFENFTDKLYKVREGIYQSGYVIDSLMGYEIIPLSEVSETYGYFQLERELFIKIRRA